VRNAVLKVTRAFQPAWSELRALSSARENCRLIPCLLNTLVLNCPHSGLQRWPEVAGAYLKVCACDSGASRRQKWVTRSGRGSSGSRGPVKSDDDALHRLSYFATAVHPEYPRSLQAYLRDRGLESLRYSCGKLPARV